MKFLCANRIAPDGMPHCAASYLGLYCLPMSHKRDAMLIRIKISEDVVKFFFLFFIISFLPNSLQYICFSNSDNVPDNKINSY